MVSFTRKRLQVFISSTYSDLLDERQAAVEAILGAGHIPAGMELFTSGDESQMEVIKQWIDESDVFLLILGGRYGSIDRETGKSYTQLEYEYALSRNKPLFACVIHEEELKIREKTLGADVLASNDKQRLGEFRKIVLSKLVSFWSEARDIKIAVGETLADFSRRKEMRGWVRSGNEARAFEVLHKLTKNTSAVGRIGLKAVEKFFEEFEVSSRGFKASSEYLALKVYQEFCGEIRDEQVARSKAGKPGLVMRISHSGPIGIWREKEAIEILNLQRQFVESGGKVVRILIDHTNGVINQEQEYAKAIKSMEDNKINAYYLRLTDSSEESEIFAESDFITVDAHNDVLMWISNYHGSRIDGCEFRQDSDGLFSAKWHQYARTLLAQKLPSGHNTQLRKQEKEFEKKDVSKYAIVLYGEEHRNSIGTDHP